MMLTTQQYLRYTHKGICFLSSFETQMLTGFLNSLSVVCDVIIMIVLCYYFSSIRMGFKGHFFLPSAK